MALEKISASDSGDRWAEFMKTEVGRDVQPRQKDVLSDDDTKEMIDMIQNNRNEMPDTPRDRFKSVAVENSMPIEPVPIPSREVTTERKERKETKKDETYRKIGKSVVALMVAVGIFAGGVIAQDGIDKGMRKSDYNEAMKNRIWATYDTTATMETTPQDIYQNIEHDFMSDRAEDMYDSKHGEGAFDELTKKDQDRGEVQQEALTDATYKYYDRESPENPERFSPDTREWAKEEIGGETTLDQIKSWFD